MSQVNVGQAVKFVNERGVEHDALVTEVGGDDVNPCINLMFVSTNKEKMDSYGRQIERHSSVVHKLLQSAQVMYWF